jgi:hypothetical protein
LFSLFARSGNENKISITCEDEGALDTILQKLQGAAREISFVSPVAGGATATANVTATAMLAIRRTKSSSTVNFNMTVSWSVFHFLTPTHPPARQI